MGLIDTPPWKIKFLDNSLKERKLIDSSKGCIPNLEGFQSYFFSIFLSGKMKKKLPCQSILHYEKILTTAFIEDLIIHLVYL